MTQPTNKPPEAGPGGEGPEKGDTFTSSNGWNFLTRTLHTKSPQALRHARRSNKSIDTLIRTSR